MKLLVVRHAQAEDRDEFARRCPDDGLRPLTKRGKRKMKDAARGLHQIVESLDTLVSSPLTRAVETAEILSEEFGIRTSERPELVPTARPGSLLKWLQHQPAEVTVAIVGHEPHLSMIASWLLTGLEETFIRLRKGAVVMIEFPDRVAAGHGKLQWIMTAGQLARCAGRE